MTYLTKDQLPLYLKMGRELTQFIGIGKYFESATFDWVRVSGSLDSSTIEVIRSIDEGDEYFCDVKSFSSIAEIDIEERREFSGNLEQCLLWLESEVGGSRERFIRKGTIDSEYEIYVRNKSTDTA